MTVRHERKGCEAMPTLPETGFVRQRDVLRVVPVAASTLWRWVADGRFPKPVRLGERVTAWRAEAVREWLDAQAGEEAR